MRKVYALLPALVFVCSIAANAQSEKKEPPPPPKPKNETTKFTPPKIVIDEEVEVKEPPVITVKGELDDEFYKRNPSVAGITRQDDIIILKKKDGTTEKYNLSKKEDYKSFTEKYGASPIPPPPPPLKKIS